MSDLAALDAAIASRREGFAAATLPRENILPFLDLPRELRDQVSTTANHERRSGNRLTYSNRSTIIPFLSKMTAVTGHYGLSDVI